MCLAMAIVLICVAIVGEYQANLVDDSENSSARNVCIKVYLHSTW